MAGFVPAYDGGSFESSEPEPRLSIEARSQTTWTGSVTVTNTYTVSVFDELIISACTEVEMGSNARIYIEGRLTIEGTEHECHSIRLEQVSGRFVSTAGKVQPPNPMTIDNSKCICALR